MHPPPDSIQINIFLNKCAKITLTALEGDIRVETLKGVRAVVNTTHPLTMTASSHRVLVREDSVAACFDLRAHALIRMRGGRTTSLRRVGWNVRETMACMLT
jgi:hypothetical protein